MLILKIIEYFFICICMAVLIGIIAFAFSPSYVSKKYKNYKKQLIMLDDMKEKGELSYNEYMAKKYKIKTRIDEIEELYKKAYEYDSKKEAKESLEEGDQYD